MNLDIGSISQTMIDAVRAALGERWSAIRAIAEPELRKLAQTLEDVRQLQADGKVDANRAFQIVEIQRNTALSVLRTIGGLGVLTARKAVDAAAHAAGDVVNRLVGFKLIGMPISQEPAKSSSTGRTKETPVVSLPKPAPRKVRVNFKAGKDL